jgi:hypothetical protein
LEIILSINPIRKLEFEGKVSLTSSCRVIVFHNVHLTCKIHFLSNIHTSLLFLLDKKGQESRLVNALQSGDISEQEVLVSPLCSQSLYGTLHKIGGRKYFKNFLHVLNY